MSRACVTRSFRPRRLPCAATGEQPAGAMSLAEVWSHAQQIARSSHVRAFVGLLGGGPSSDDPVAVAVAIARLRGFEVAPAAFRELAD